jgi:uncharacterized protein (DUF697 family)
MKDENTNFDENEDKESLRKKLEDAKKEAKELGGWQSFKNGEWLYLLIKKSFHNYWEKGNAEYFKEKYKTDDEEFICKKLISIAARNASILGGIIGATVSIDEILAVIEAISAPATGGGSTVPIPAQVAVAIAALTGEAVLLVRMQLQLVANIGKIYMVNLDPDDPEDILTILAFAVGGSVAEEAGKFGMKVGGKLAANAAKGIFKKETLAALKKIGTKLGIKILQRTIIKYVVPLASIGIGMTWNYFSTKSIGKIARKHFLARRNNESDKK